MLSVNVRKGNKVLHELNVSVDFKVTTLKGFTVTLQDVRNKTNLALTDIVESEGNGSDKSG